MSQPFSWITGNAMVCSPKETSKLSKDFLFYCLDNSDLSSVITGSAQPQITRSSIEKFPIPLPPIEVQQQIVDELEVYQKIIDGCRQVVENYKPTINNESTYEMVSLGNKDLFEVLSGGTPKSDETSYWNGEVKWISLVDLPESNFVNQIHNSKRTITELGLKNSSAKMIPVNSVVVSSRATIGRVGINRIPLSTNQGFKNIVIKDESRILCDYLAYMMANLTTEMIDLANGVTFKEISKNNFENLRIPLPPLELQQQIVDELDGFQKTIDGNKRLIEIYNKKIQDRISKVWGNE